MLRLVATATLILIGTAWSAGSAAGQPTLTSLTLDASSVTGSASLNATVTLDGPAPPRGVSIRLTSSVPSVARVPGTVLIPAKLNSRTFQIETTPLAANPSVIPPGVEVVISARGPGGPDRSVIRRATLRVLPPFVDAIGFLGPVRGGNPAFGFVMLTGPAPAGGVTVSVASANEMLAAVPASVSVAAGNMVGLVQVATNGVVKTTPVDISASRGPFNTKTGTLQVLPPALADLVINPPSVPGGTAADGRVYLLGEVAASSQIQVTLSSTDPASATPDPSPLIIPAEARRGDFKVLTQSVDAPTTVTISAFYDGVTKDDTLEVLPPPPLQSLTLTPGTVFGGNSSDGEVTLSAAAPAGGASVSLSHTHNCPQPPTVPGSVTVLENQQTGGFAVETVAVARNCEVRIRAQYLGACLEATLRVRMQDPGPQPAAMGVPCAGVSR